MKRDDIVRKMDEIRPELMELARAESLSDEQVTQRDELKIKYDNLESDLKRSEEFAEEQQELLARMERARPAPSFEADPLNGEVDPVKTLNNPWDRDAILRASEEELFSRALSAAEVTSGPNDARREALTRMIEQSDSGAARLVLATTHPDYKTAWGKLARSGGKENTLSEQERDALDFAQTIRRGVSTTDAEGGYLIPTDIEPNVTISTDGTNNPLWDAARRVQTTSKTYRVVTSDDATWSWDGENTEVSDDTPTFANQDIPLYYAQGFVPVSIASGASVQNITADVSRQLMFGWDVLIGAALTTGSGSSQPTGIVTALTGSATPSAGADTFAVGDVYAIHEAVASRHRRRGTWMGNIAAINDIRQFATDDGHALLARLGDGDPQRLLGRPLLENEDMDGTINAAAENYYLLFGDLSHFVIAEGIGMVSEFIPHVFGANGRPIGARGFYAGAWLGSDSVLDGAFALLNVT